LRHLRVKNTALVLDKIVSRCLSMDGEVRSLGAALSQLVALLLHGSDIVGAVAGLDGAFGEERRVGVCVAAGVGWCVGVRCVFFYERRSWLGM
jgi:hypothetical protein